MNTTPQPPFPPDACPVCGRPGRDGHFCDECVDEMERRGIDWEVMEPDEMREALRATPEPEPEAAPDDAPGEFSPLWTLTAAGVLAVLVWVGASHVGDLVAYWTASERKTETTYHERRLSESELKDLNIKRGDRRDRKVKSRTLYYYRNDGGEWVRLSNVGLLDSLLVWLGALIVGGGCVWVLVVNIRALRRKKTPNLDLGKDGPGKRA